MIEFTLLGLIKLNDEVPFMGMGNVVTKPAFCYRIIQHWYFAKTSSVCVILILKETSRENLSYLFFKEIAHRKVIIYKCCKHSFPSVMTYHAANAQCLSVLYSQRIRCIHMIDVVYAAFISLKIHTGKMESWGLYPFNPKVPELLPAVKWMDTWVKLVFKTIFGSTKLTNHRGIVVTLS